MSAVYPVFLNSDGLPSGATCSTIGLRWLAPESLWVRETRIFHGAGGVYSPGLGTTVAKPKKKPKSTGTSIKASWNLKENVK